MFTQAKQAFLFALMFLTRLPVGRWVMKPEADTATRAVYFYPLVGLVIGVILAAAAIVMSGLGVLLASALLLCLWVVITGALHLDGLADCMDAYYAGHKHTHPEERRKRILSVMHDPSCGAVALVSLVLLLLVKFAALASLNAGWQAALALLVAPLLARTAILPFVALSEYARYGGKVPDTLSTNSQRLWLISLLVTALMLLVLGWVNTAVLVACVFALLLYWRRLWHNQIGGYTGDCLGALVELSEALVLIVLVALW
ncbi:adenosylcobinamide-GDP ribazoletransferase [Gilvimarinus xylanilyticus]|uniref:Adenosylcobinamide-GDP ribazoletransferase n=1 Tax=Gilvimarinus xylanilyticus TaxID=2944139 RepID=A0A9X2HYY0_9GAMM|nr:adenosylcobinamide-GDP ribazoletransferase [Gilvimarinus xylanilyticus]MCP8899071.1 adenosylcobinamide-GDP ribazoletransferase [Gilvimarinus xylanilyticus]